MGLSNDITEEDIRDVVGVFGEIVKVKIPFEELRNGLKRRRNFAFVTFDNIKSATRAVEEGEVTVEYATLKVDRALARAPMQNSRDHQNRSDFELLKRRT